MALKLIVFTRLGLNRFELIRRGESPSVPASPFLFLFLFSVVAARHSRAGARNKLISIVTCSKTDRLTHAHDQYLCQ